MPHHVYGAVDIGGTKIAAGLVDTEGELLHRVVLPTPARGSAQEVFATVAKLIDALAEDPRWARVVGVGIGSAGPVDPRAGTVSPVNIPGWREYPLVAQVAALPAVAEPGAAAPQGRVVTLIGDASAMAAGEHWRGAARGHDDVLCLVVSTGVGAGLIMDGALRTGPSGNAGHLGHITVDFEGEACPCGSFGCVETMSSGTSIARWAVANGWRPEPLPAPGSASAPSANGRGDNVVNSMRAEGAATEGAANGIATIDRAHTAANTPLDAAATAAATLAAAPPAPAPASATAADVAASALLGNEIALAAFDRAGRALAAGIAAAATLADLRVAVVGGGVAKAGPLLFDPLRRHLERYASLPFTRGMVVLPATLGGDAGLIGAAAALAAALPPDAAARRR